jgi:hypothetical protein
MASEARSETSSIPPDHHLWRNGRLWWVAFTVHLPGWQKERIRLSLGTADLEEARRRRDQLLSEYPRATGCELSLRIDRPRGRREGSMWRQPGRAA